MINSRVEDYPQTLSCIHRLLLVLPRSHLKAGLCQLRKAKKPSQGANNSPKAHLQGMSCVQRPAILSKSVLSSCPVPGSCWFFTDLKPLSKRTVANKPKDPGSPQVTSQQGSAKRPTSPNAKRRWERLGLAA